MTVVRHPGVVVPTVGYLTPAMVCRVSGPLKAEAPSVEGGPANDATRRFPGYAGLRH